MLRATITMSMVVAVISMILAELTYIFAGLGAFACTDAGRTDCARFGVWALSSATVGLVAWLLFVVGGVWLYRTMGQERRYENGVIVAGSLCAAGSLVGSSMAAYVLLHARPIQRYFQSLLLI
jgi:hypothetical protein